MSRLLHAFASMLLVAPALSSRVALANGGPVAFTEATAEGNAMPLVDSPITLKSEDLRIRIEDDGVHYEVEARYRLVNRGDATTVRYGVPMAWSDEPRTPQEWDAFEGEHQAATELRLAALRAPRRLTERAREAASAIRLRVGGKEVPSCTPKAFTPPVRGKEGDTRMLPAPPVTALPVSDQLLVEGWCVATVDLPSGPVDLELRYRGEMRFEDVEVSKSALRYYGDRALSYPLFPAGFWSGPVEQLRIRLDPGPFASHTKVESPAGAERRDGHFVWELDDVDLKALGTLQAQIAAHPLLTSRDLGLWNARREEPAAQVSAKTSSELQSKKAAYAPGNLTDGKLETAWCEGAEGPGVGEWIEVRFKPYCQLQGLAIVPGYAKSAALLTANGRVRKVRVSSCSEPSNAKTVELKLPSNPAFAGQLLEVPEPGPDEGEQRCLRLKFVEVAEGSKHQDTCVSELAPVYNCG